jgi:hypothetical protein
MKRYLYRLTDKSGFCVDPYYYPRTQAEKIRKEARREAQRDKRRPSKIIIAKVFEITADGQRTAMTV